MIGMIMFFFFNDTATTEIYTLSLHDALPISRTTRTVGVERLIGTAGRQSHSPWWKRSSTARQASRTQELSPKDRKSTRLNSSHANISYAVFCLTHKTNSQTTFLLCRCYIYKT